MSEPTNEPTCEVILVSIPDDDRVALFIDGQLSWQDRWMSAATLLRKLIQRGVVHGGQRFADKETLNDVGQFPRQLSDITTRERMYP